MKRQDKVQTDNAVDPSTELDQDTVVDQSVQSAGSSESDRRYACRVNTPNAIINGKKHASGDSIEGGLTADQIREHRRRGVAIICPDLKDEIAERTSDIV